MVSDARLGHQVKALANRLLVVLDLHEYEVMGSDPAGNRQRFLSVWGQISERYRSSAR